MVRLFLLGLLFASCLVPATVYARVIKAEPQLYFFIEKGDPVFGYKREKPDEQGNNYITCTEKSLKVDYEILMAAAGGCKEHGGKGILAAGIITKIDRFGYRVTLVTGQGKVVDVRVSPMIIKSGLFAEGDMVFAVGSFKAEAKGETRLYGVQSSGLKGMRRRAVK